ncbi:Nramp family divalent metal transporter, partial [Bacillus haynesii]|nr:Nramp family divalent metal transporter [Bacillus haynesii]
LFGIPMLEASIIAAAGSFAILELQRRGVRPLEAAITGMLFIVVIAFAFQTFFAKPDIGSVLEGMFVPRFDGADSILLAAGILGATVMPHAIYL